MKDEIWIMNNVDYMLRCENIGVVIISLTNVFFFRPLFQINIGLKWISVRVPYGYCLMKVK